jgi:hypothetical protein
MKLLRKWRAKGHGIHSPFAYQLVTNVIHSPHKYYAFFDIENQLPDIGKRNKTTVAFNQLSFRLVRHFSAKNVLKINFDDSVNKMFIAAAHQNAHCICVKTDEMNINSFENRSFDAIFIHSGENKMPTVETLFSFSHDNTFWVVRQINSKQGKPFWRSILRDERVKVTFDLKETGIVFLQSAQHKLNYYV